MTAQPQALSERLFHVSEQANIKLFEPRPSPSYFSAISGDVVFAITGKLLHNYLLPRDCPRVTYYATENSTAADRDKFIGASSAKYVVIVESKWYTRIKQTILYCYEFDPLNFVLIDNCAGYYVSYEAVIPIKEQRINHVFDELLNRGIELRFTPSLIDIAEKVSRSSLNFSLIRMRNAAKPTGNSTGPD